MPIALFAEGDLDALRLPQIAIVGSRNPTPTGTQVAERFARALAGAGVCITSGLATGIDAAAHSGALKADGMTIAVCGRGLADVYPARNRELAARIAASGLLLSEYTPDTAPARSHFPARNRIIAALTLGTLVVEAAPGSGSLITAKQAANFSREVFAIPGSIDNPLSKGCHQLIREGAHLTESAADIVEILGSDMVKRPVTVATKNRDLRSLETDIPAHQQLLSALDDTPTTVDTLASRTGMSTAEISSTLLILELQGTVAIAPGGGYQRISKST